MDEVTGVDDGAGVAQGSGVTFSVCFNFEFSTHSCVCFCLLGVENSVVMV